MQQISYCFIEWVKFSYIPHNAAGSVLTQVKKIMSTYKVFKTIL